MGVGTLKPINKAVFFDRDGVLNDCCVINGKPFPPVDTNQLIISKYARASLSALKKEGFLLICVTNQPDVARGINTLENVQKMNDKVLKELPLDKLYCCFHDNIDKCNCRKPKPGMLLQGQEEFSLDLRHCYMIGDRTGDIQAGRSAGCFTVFLDRDYDEQKPDPPADFTCNNLEEATSWIIKKTESNY